jgi:hypothetical protein
MAALLLASKCSRNVTDDRGLRSEDREKANTSQQFTLFFPNNRADYSFTQQWIRSTPETSSISIAENPNDVNKFSDRA